jgi:DNA-directed RNA polymerase subunit RPC12/RpoP
MNTRIKATRGHGKTDQFGKWPIKLAGQLFLGKKYYCTWCGAEAEGFKDKRSAAEFRASGMCQTCQDEIFAKEKDTRKRERHYD